MDIKNVFMETIESSLFDSSNELRYYRIMILSFKGKETELMYQDKRSVARMFYMGK